MDASPLGIPAAIGLIAAFVLFVVGAMVADYLIIRRWGSKYSMTDGIRWLLMHYPLAAILIVFLLGELTGGLIVHFAQFVGFVP